MAARLDPFLKPYLAPFCLLVTGEFILIFSLINADDISSVWEIRQCKERLQNMTDAVEKYIHLYVKEHKKHKKAQAYIHKLRLLEKERSNGK